MYATKIKSIKSLGKIQTYDLHTPKHHNFLLDNGILSHNSGKSFASVTIIYWCYVYMHGKPPTVEDMKQHWFFTGKSFLKRMNNPALKKKELNLWDEMGTAASHKTHQSLQNRAISWLVQTFRNLEQLVIFTVPTLAYVDKSVRNLLHFQLETRNILQKDKICIIKPLELQYQIRMDKMYYHNLLYPSETEKGMMDEVDVVGIPLPPPEFVKAYEEMSWEFKSKLNKQIQEMLSKAEEKENGISDEEKFWRRCTSNQKMVLDYYRQGIVSTNKIAELEDTSASNVSQYIRSLRNKGVNMDNIKKYPRKTDFLGNLDEKSEDTT